MRVLNKVPVGQSLEFILEQSETLTANRRMHRLPYPVFFCFSLSAKPEWLTQRVLSLKERSSTEQFAHCTLVVLTEHRV